MNLLSVADISKMTRIPAPTARRYASLFKDFLCGTKVGRVTRYPEESVQVFNRISQLYSEGRVTHEIEEILRSEMPRTIDVETTDQCSVPTPVSNAELNKAFGDVLDRVASCMEVIADQKKIIERQQDDVQKLKTAFVMLARSQKRIKALPAAPEPPTELVESYRKLEEKDQELEEMAMSLSLDASDIKVKLQTLESELVRLRKDRREMEKYLQDKIDRLKSEANS